MTIFFGATSYLAFQSLVKDPQKFYDQQAKDSATKTKIEYFKKHIGDYDNVDDLTKDRKLMEVLLMAYGLEDQLDLMGRIKVVLKEDTADSNSLSNKLADSKYKTMAADLALFEEDGFAKLSDESFVNSLVDKYIMAATEKTMGEQDDALRQAAYFARNIDTAEGVYNILGDKVLRSVITKYLELPDQFAVQSVESQAAYIEKRIDIDKLLEDVDTKAITNVELDNAKNNLSTLDSAQSVADAATTQIDTLKTLLETVVEAYAEQEVATDPSGPYADEIPVQEAAIPELLRVESMASAMQETLDTVTPKLERLEELLNLAKNPANAGKLTSYKNEFSSTVNSIISAINSTSSYNPATGTTENPLMFGSNTTLSIQTTAAGDTVNFKVYDLSDLQSYLNSASASFSAVTSASDTTNLNAATASFDSANIRGLGVNEFHKENLASLESGVGAVEVFVATMNTQEISLGYNSIQDSLRRISTIEGYLAQIKDLADESADMVSTADRSELQAQFEELRTAIRDEIENSGLGLDNFLNNLATQNYDIMDGATLKINGGFDLATTISDVLDTKGIDTLSGAQEMQTLAISLTTKTDAAKFSLTDDQGLFASTALVYDPRAAIDATITGIQSNLDAYIEAAAYGGNNLLSADQSDLSYTVTSSYSTLKLRAYNDFGSEFAALIDSVVVAMSVGTEEASAAAQSALDYLNDVGRTLGSDSRKINFEYAKSAAVVDTLDTTEEEDENPYTTTSYVQKFIEKFLILNGSDNLMSTDSSNSYVLNLFGVNSDGSSTDYMSKIFELLA